ncbi:MAG: GNAT family N-acetyltransferase [Armatimonadetes bacterium]|nr:GNAT family N-acetyltransferase [Armatimonadota bacterium]
MAQETEGLALKPSVVGEGVRRALEDPAKALYFVAEVGGEVAGMLMITHEWSDWRNGDIWWIQSVYVWPEFRRRGVFRALFEHVRTAALESHAAGLRLYVEAQNDTALRTYASLGMQRTSYHLMEQVWGG